jgi:V-type H+-transporting ATPase subunit E
MKMFISQEAQEKADEISVKAEEEFNIEKGRLLQTEKLKIDNYYDRKEKQVELQRKIQHSTQLNSARLSILKAKDDHIKTILDEAKMKIGEVTKDVPRYQQLLKEMITQCLYQLLEQEVVIRCRKQDLNLVKAVCDSAVASFKNGTGIDCKAKIDSEFLPSDR